MAKKRTTEATDLSKVHVKLKPFLGMEPGLYLTIIYALILLLIIFLLLFLPGIRHWGSEVSVKTAPEGAAIYVDGKYVGATPNTVFVAAGTHNLSIRKPFYGSLDNKVDVGGRLFGSLFFPRRERFSYQLSVDNLNGLLAHSFHDLSRWAMVNSFLPNYRLPPIVQDTVSGALQSRNFTNHKALWAFVRSAMGDVHNPQLLSDFTAGVGALAGKSAVATPESLLKTLRDSLSLGNRYPDLAFWLAHSMPTKEQKAFESSSSFSQAKSAYLSRLSSFKPTTQSGGGATVGVDGMRFIYVPGGSYIMGAAKGAVPSSVDVGSLAFPHIVQVPGYYMLSTQVTHAEYARFVAQNPKWAPSAAATLAKEGVATSEYLKGWANAPGADYPQNYVSFYAAEAFCQWLQKQLPPSLAGYTVRLPSAAEWEHAARMDVSATGSVFHDSYDSLQPAGTGAANSLGIRGLLGNVWEWTSSWYLPSAYFLASRSGTSTLTGQLVGNGAERAVRGGSWANSQRSVTYTTRGSQPPDWCTAYLGFRPIIVKG